MRKKKKKNSRKWIIPTVSGIALILAALWIWLPDHLDNLKSAQNYEDLRKEYVQAPSEDEKEEKKDWWLTDVLINFEDLKKQNEDIIAWIRFDNTEALGIDYPVLYSGDNTTYLRHDLYGGEHIAGSIFLEGLNQPDFSDYYTILYGHNMRDGSMFGSLDKYKKQGFWNENQYFTLYTEDTVYRWQIFACRVEHTISRKGMEGISDFLLWGDVYDRNFSNMDLSLLFEPGRYDMAMEIYEIERRNPRVIAREWELFEPYACLAVNDGRSSFYLRKKDGAQEMDLWYRKEDNWIQAPQEKGRYCLESSLFTYTVSAKFPVTEGSLMIAVTGPGKEPLTLDCREINIHIV